MSFFLFLVVAAILSFVLLVTWASIRVAKLGGNAGRIEQLERELDRVNDRLALLETRSSHAPALTLQSAHPQPAPIAERCKPHTPPVRQVRASMPPSPACSTDASTKFIEPLTTELPQRVAPPPQPSAAPLASVPLGSSSSPGHAHPESVPHPRSAPVVSVKRVISLEERLGQNWLNKLGIIALVTGVVLLLGYQLRNFGPVGKSVTGFVISSALLVTGLVLESRDRYRRFARVLIGGGWALLFFVAFALFHVPAMQLLHSQATDLLLMMAVACAMVVHSLRYRSQVVTSLAFLLGFLAIAISHVTVFSLIAGGILAAGLLVVASRQRWFGLALGGLVAVYLNHGLWLHRLLSGAASPRHPFPELLPSTALLLFYWFIFRLFYIVRVPATEGDRVCSTLNGLLNSAGLLTLLKYQSTHPEWAFRDLLALGTAELVLAFFSRRRHHHAFVVLASIASLCLLAAIPFHFAGTSWSLLWLLQAEMLFLAGLALRETVFRRLGIVSIFASTSQLIVGAAIPLFHARQLASDSRHHAVITVAFGCAAFTAWFNAELAPRRWPHLVGEAFDRATLRIMSYTAALCAGVALWIALAGPWTLLPWLALALLLAYAAQHLRSQDLAQQADLLNLAVVVRAVLINTAHWNRFAGSPRTLILLLTGTLLHANMRRQQAACVLAQKDIAPAYAWAATGVLSVLAWYALQPAAVALAWALLATVLLEQGLAKRRTFFRHQAYVLLTAGFVRLFFINIALAPAPRMYTMLPLAALFAWACQRLHGCDQPKQLDRFAGATSAWFALATVVALLYFSLRPAWVATGGAALAVAVLLLARTGKRPLFTAQAITLILLTAARTLAFNLFSPEPLAPGFTASRSLTTGLPCLLLFAALPMAFSLRKQRAGAEDPSSRWGALLLHPEQVLFFAPLAILSAWVPVQLHGGAITVGWCILGLLTFLFALAVGERSFRLAGLGLLLTGVGKVVTVDIWHASPTDRYLTLIVIGAALLFVSFLYSRYRETILELL